MPNEIDTLDSYDQQNRGSRADPGIPSGIVRHSTCWLTPPFGQGEPKEVEATPEVLTPLLITGWSQCDPPATVEEVTTNVHD